MAEEKPQKSSGPGLRVADLLGERKLSLQLLAGGSGAERDIILPHLQKPGLILAGHLEYLNPDKIQILGLTDISYLEGLEEKELRHIVDRLMAQRVIAFIATKNLRPPPYFIEAAEKRKVAVLFTPERTSTFIRKLTAYLEKKLAPQTTMHGVLMSIQGVGVLILGKSGIGKSECALDLVYQGHRLVADDLIYLQRIGPEVLMGYGPEVVKHHMEIRGLGIINIKNLFGFVSVMDSARVELVIELVEWDAGVAYDRLGLEEETTSILELDIPRIRIPVSPGRNLAVILETAARNHLLKKSGLNAARELELTLNESLRRGAAEKQPGKEAGSR